MTLPDCDSPQTPQFPCFREGDPECSIFTQKKILDRENDYHIWVIPLLGSEEFDLPKLLNLSELLSVFPTDFYLPEFFSCEPVVGSKFWEIMDELNLDQLGMIFDRVSPNLIPASAIVSTLRMFRQNQFEPCLRFDPDVDMTEPIKFFTNFAKYVDGLDIEEVDRVVWGCLMQPFNFYDLVVELCDDEAFLAPLIRSMVYPFTEYLAKLPQDEGGNQNGFFMWWDIVLGMWIKDPAPPCVLEALREILALPHGPSQAAALHGINHLASAKEREKLIDQSIKKGYLLEDLREFAAICRLGQYM